MCIYIYVVFCFDNLLWNQGRYMNYFDFEWCHPTSYCDTVSDISSGIIYGRYIYILTLYLTFFLAWTMKFYLTFYLTFILCDIYIYIYILSFYRTFFLAFCLTFTFTFYLAIFVVNTMTFYLTLFLAFCLSYIRIFYLTLDILSGILSEIFFDMLSDCLFGI